MKKLFVIATMSFGALFGLIACDGPREEAGEELDEAAEEQKEMMEEKKEAQEEINEINN